ncbi:aminoacyl--tRNA ligase-related protein [Streptomyces sp. NPDC007945]|uniref:aminoacyl--tRNA ligase-related protein n=1 Tax=Streptomyces sp. NPDC007945 TaxID=3364797 RepID=UPI0036E8275C
MTAYERTRQGWTAPTGLPGALGLSPRFEAAVAGLQQALNTAGAVPSAGPVWYPPVVPRELLERAEYAESFPHLLGTVHALAEGADRSEGPAASGVALAPAACYSVYPSFADRELAEAAHADVAGYCYRHEATTELGRFRSFRMREFVMVGDADATLDWRDEWIARGEALFSRLGLKVTVQSATDPFFGPGGRFMRASQLEQSLKYEFVAPVAADDEGTAIASANYHKDHLGARFGITYADRGTAHSACTAFGLERVVLALLHAHGDDRANWPTLTEEAI